MHRIGKLKKLISNHYEKILLLFKGNILNIGKMEGQFRHTDYVYKRSYRGKVKGAILDWSGTTVDAYVIAPAVVFVDVFKKHGVPISMQEARKPMGLRKDLHIKAITEMPDVREIWNTVY